MTVYYLGPDARITDEVFESRCPQPRSFVIQELDYVHTLREDAIQTAVTSTPVRVCTTGASGVAVVVTAVGWPVFGQPTVTAAGLVILAAGVTLATAGLRTRRQPLEIRAVYRGVLVCLYKTTDRRTLGQVRRALLRVIECNEDRR